MSPRFRGDAVSVCPHRIELATDDQPQAQQVHPCHENERAFEHAEHLVDAGWDTEVHPDAG